MGGNLIMGRVSREIADVLLPPIIPQHFLQALSLLLSHQFANNYIYHLQCHNTLCPFITTVYIVGYSRCPYSQKYLVVFQML